MEHYSNIALYPMRPGFFNINVSVFRSIKLARTKAVREWCNQHPNELVTKLNFPYILENILSTCVSPETKINGFRVCGLYQFNVENIDFLKCPGKSQYQKVGTSENINVASIIKYEQFGTILGEEKIRLIET